MGQNKDYLNLPANYRAYYDGLVAFIDPARLMIDPLRLLAYGTDASFYRLNPKLVVKVATGLEVSRLLGLSSRLGIPVTFRAAGTSLSGQTVTDSVLVLLSGRWKGARILDEGARIALEPGVIGAQANALLAPFGRKIGPDPASIGSCMIGGIAANNASGMCCGTDRNSYRTVRQMKVTLADGTELDTADAESRRAFYSSHASLVKELEAIRDEIARDAQLSARIREKYRIKNTTGYGLNSFLDYSDPVEILMHLMIGSEGTLGFISEITYETVAEERFKASALVFLRDLKAAGRVTALLKGHPVSAVELMDRFALKSVEGKAGMPELLKALPENAAALLVETRAEDSVTLQARIEELEKALRASRPLHPVKFTTVREEYERYWDIRRGLYPAVGAARRSGTTVVIEDVVFPVERLAEGAVDLQELLQKHGYSEGILFGHALDGNLHFVFTQDFSTEAEVSRYQWFMDAVCDLVVRKYNGSLKGEHGTGRNVAPFVRFEWGAEAHELMKRIKRAFDPAEILNPGVILNDDANIHVQNLKPMPAAHEVIDRCIECGFCEVMCPSRALTLTPRMRIVARREISRLQRAGEDASRFLQDYAYQGEETCATCGLCSTACPVGIDTGKLTKLLRAAERTPNARKIAQQVADRFSLVLGGMRTGLKGAGLLKPGLPRPAHSFRFESTQYGFSRRVVYFPSCVARTLGPDRADGDTRALFETTLSVLKKAGFDVIFPKGLEAFCCGLAFESKGFPEQGEQKLRELERELLLASEQGWIPILCDTSPCVQRMKAGMDSRLRLYEPVEFAHDLILPQVKIRKLDETVAIHVTCSASKMGLAGKFKAVAEACATQVVLPPGVGCCGFAGDKGFTLPELNASALASLKGTVTGRCESGYSNSRTCEIGLSLHGGIPYRSILSLLDRCIQ